MGSRAVIYIGIAVCALLVIVWWFSPRFKQGRLVWYLGVLFILAPVVLLYNLFHPKEARRRRAARQAERASRSG